MTDEHVTIEQLSRELQEVARETRDVAKDMHAIRRLGIVASGFFGLFAVFVTSGAIYIATSVIEHNLQITTMQSQLESHGNSATPHPVQLLSQATLVQELALIKQELTNMKQELLKIQGAQNNTSRR
jgi:hypothetical protein